MEESVAALLDHIENALALYVRSGRFFPVTLKLQYSFLLYNVHTGRLREFYASTNTEHSPSFRVLNGRDLGKIRKFLSQNPVSEKLKILSGDLKSGWIFICLTGVCILLSKS